MALRHFWDDRHYLADRKRDALIRWVAWHLPKRLVMWCYYRVFAHATSGMGKNGRVDASKITAMEVIDSYSKYHRL